MRAFRDCEHSTWLSHLDRENLSGGSSSRYKLLERIQQRIRLSNMRLRSSPDREELVLPAIECVRGAENRRDSWHPQILAGHFFGLRFAEYGQ